jgi:2,3-bisphosphoglycerate-dependent phosphoglycerate mutase
MNTTVYMVRHAESPYTEGDERTRGLTPAGELYANKVTGILKDEEIDVIISSPYARAVLTVEGLAQHLNKEIITFEDLRERDFSGEDYIITDDEFMPAIMRMFEDPDYSLPGGESNSKCQARASKVLRTLLEEHQGKKMVIGTHGNVMTLMMNHFDASYGLDFFMQTKKPDIYKLEFIDMELQEVRRLWNE